MNHVTISVECVLMDVRTVILENYVTIVRNSHVLIRTAVFNFFKYATFYKQTVHYLNILINKNLNNLKLIVCSNFAHLGFTSLKKNTVLPRIYKNFKIYFVSSYFSVIKINFFLLFSMRGRALRYKLLFDVSP